MHSVTIIFRFKDIKLNRKLQFVTPSTKDIRKQAKERIAENQRTDISEVSDKFSIVAIRTFKFDPEKSNA